MDSPCPPDPCPPDPCPPDTCPPETPSKGLSDLKLGSATPKRRREFISDGSLSPSVFDDTPDSRRAYSPQDTPFPLDDPFFVSQGQTGPTGTLFITDPPDPPTPTTPPSKRHQSFDHRGVTDSHEGVGLSPRLPNEVWNMIFDYLIVLDLPEDLPLRPLNVYDFPVTKKVLSELRLVNKKWASILGPRVFKQISVLPGRARDPFEPVFKASVSQWADLVRDVTFGIVGAWHSGERYDAYITNLSTGAGSVLLTRFNNIHTLRLQSPTVVAPPEDQIPLVSLSQLTSSIVHSLRYVTLPQLKCLHFTVPVTAEFARFFNAESYYSDNFDDILSRIKEMHIIINDDSGMDGFRERRNPRSALKTRYPFQAFAMYLTAFVAAAGNITTLSIETRGTLDLSDLDAHKLTNLESLKLIGASMKFETLRDIFRVSKNTLSKLALKDVKLTTGTWHDVFELEFTHHPVLAYVALLNSGYTRTGANPQFYYPQAEGSPLLTKNTADWVSYRALRDRLFLSRRIRDLPSHTNDQYSDGWWYI